MKDLTRIQRTVRKYHRKDYELNGITEVLD